MCWVSLGDLVFSGFPILLESYLLSAVFSKFSFNPTYKNLSLLSNLRY